MVSLKSFAVKEPAYVLYSFFLGDGRRGLCQSQKTNCGWFSPQIMQVIRKGLIWPGGEPPLPTEPP